MYRLLPIAIALASVASAGIITITDIVDPNNLTTTSPDGTFVVAPDGTSSDLLSWTGVQAEVFNFDTSDLSLSGLFVCGSTGGNCVDSFAIDFTGTGFGPGTTAFISLVGSTSTSMQLQGSFFQTGVNATTPSAIVNANGSTPFDVSSATFAIDNKGSFSGIFFLDINMGNGNFTLPALSTADLVVTPGAAVPEPGTIAIVAACILLLVYVKRLRRA
jgi:hypothetical protein